MAQRRTTFQAILVAVFLTVEPCGWYGIWMRSEFTFMARPLQDGGSGSATLTLPRGLRVVCGGSPMVAVPLR